MDEDLMAAVLASPGDDAPRLAYADWLEEHAGPCSSCEKGLPGWRRYTRPDYPTGKPPGYKRPRIRVTCEACGGTGQNLFAERAELIRVQCELYRYERTKSCQAFMYSCYEHGEVCGCADDKTETLRARERTLLETHGEGWLGTQSYRPGFRVDGSFEVRLPRGSSWFIFHRGFVAEVQLSTEALMGGGSCGCNLPDDPEEPCPDCKGTGLNPGLAATLFESHPVTEIRLTGREPSHSTRNGKPVYWWIAATNSEPLIEPSFVPRFLWDTGQLGGYGQFDTSEAAHTALSRACVAFGRRRAGLPPMNWEKVG
jgi:uncharacterized protein (TIGR02996 family)